MLAETRSPLRRQRTPATIQLRELLSEQPRNGWSPPAIYQTGGGTPVLTLSAVTGFLYDGSRVKLTSAPTTEGAHYWLRQDELLITRSNTPELVGHAAIYDGTPANAICCDLIMKMRVDTAKADVRFIQYCLRSPAVRQFITQRAKGGSGTMQKITKRDVQQIPIPQVPLPEQRRLVARIGELESREQELRSLNASLVEDATRMLAAEYNRICRDAASQPIGKVAKLVRRRVKTQPDESYHELGIRSFGRGTFHKPALTGLQLGTKRVFRIRPGDLVFMNVFAWEGAIAVAKPEDEGRVASHRFMMHEVDPAQATAEFLCYHLLTEHGLERIRAASPGSAGRNRTLGIKKLHAISVPVPPVEAQRRFSRLHALRDRLRGLQAETEAELASFMPALVARAVRGEL